LIDDMTIAVIPVPRQLPALLSEPTGPGPSTLDARPSLLLVGDVDYGGSHGVAGEQIASRSAAGRTQQGVFATFEKLAAAGPEIAAIRSSFKTRFSSGSVDTLDKALASESAFRAEAGKHRWLHVATHGFFAPTEIKSALAAKTAGAGPIESPFGRSDVTGFHPGLLSGLALAGANTPASEGEDDGILTALEVASLDLSSVEVAVLSACDTGLGEVAGGEGVLGLQRAFQVAGARNVVCSLWKVDDQATAALMNVFYRKLWQENKPPIMALREAQLTLLHHPQQIPQLADSRAPAFAKPAPLPDGGAKTAAKTADPRLWAAFVISGAPQNVAPSAAPEK
jgi:CHAT domain-containing protein